MSHDYPACAVFRGGKCTCDEGEDDKGGECFQMLDPNVPEMGSRYPEKGCYRPGCPIHGGPGGFPPADGVQEPLADLILRLHREGHSEDEIAAELMALGRASEADAAGISIDAVIADASGVLAPTHQPLPGKTPKEHQQ